MSNQLDEVIKDIAVKHGVVIGRDDPILMLHTMNTKLMNDNSLAQREILNQYKSELEEISHRWGRDAKEKSERILNAALIASKEVMNKQITESTESVIQNIKLEIGGARRKPPEFSDSF